MGVRHSANCHLRAGCLAPRIPSWLFGYWHLDQFFSPGVCNCILDLPPQRLLTTVSFCQCYLSLSYGKPAWHRKLFPPHALDGAVFFRLSCPTYAQPCTHCLPQPAPAAARHCSIKPQPPHSCRSRLRGTAVNKLQPPPAAGAAKLCGCWASLLLLLLGCLPLPPGSGTFDFVTAACSFSAAACCIAGIVLAASVFSRLTCVPSVA